MGQTVVDATATNNRSFSRIQPEPIDNMTYPVASGRWYMSQYELAYDPNISNDINGENLLLNCFFNYQNVTDIKLNGEIEGVAKAATGLASSTSNNSLASLKTVGEAAGKGTLGGLGLGAISRYENTPTKDKPRNNKIGLSDNLFNALKNGLSSALSGQVSQLPGIILSAIFGGSSSSATANYNISLEVDLRGSATNSGALPNTPITFYIPGTNITHSSPGYMSLYDKSLGVINFAEKPIVNIIIDSREEIQERGDREFFTSFYEEWHYFPNSIDYSQYLIINPELEAIADVEIVGQDLVLEKESGYCVVNSGTLHFEWSRGDGEPYFPGFENYYPAVRLTIKVIPKNNAPVSTIVKSFRLAGNTIYRYIC